MFLSEKSKRVSRNAQYSYVLRQANTAALQERAIATAETDAHLHAVTKQANKAFARTDSFAQKNVAETDAKSKRPKKV